MIAVPLLSLTMAPIAAAALLLPIFLLSDLVAVYLYRKHYDLPNVKILLPAGLMGIVLGWSMASSVSDVVVSLLIGLMGVAFCLNVWFRKAGATQQANRSIPRGIFWGTLSGFTSFVAHAGAPPYQIYLLPQKLPRLVFAGTTTVVFTAVNLAKIVPYSLIEPYTLSSIKTSLAFLPFALFGTILGKFSVAWLSDEWFYRLVQIALFLICLRLISIALIELL